MRGLARRGGRALRLSFYGFGWIFSAFALLRPGAARIARPRFYPAGAPGDNPNDRSNIRANIRPGIYAARRCLYYAAARQGLAVIPTILPEAP